jgi:pyridoxal phosphate enzyme (YggS family)
MSIAQNITQFNQSLPLEVKLVAVSKTKSNEAIMEAYQSGQRLFGENKVQELLQKWEALPKDIEWHFIGHLQSNKVKYLAPFISMIHAVDSYKLLQTINDEGRKIGRIVPCLVQFHIAEEQSKFGLDPDSADLFFQDVDLANLKHVAISGVMGMATFTPNTTQIDQEFLKLKNLFEVLKTTVFSQNTGFSEISMGMSHDYQQAIRNGSTMVRIGSSIFGDQNDTP